MLTLDAGILRIHSPLYYAACCESPKHVILSRFSGHLLVAEVESRIPSVDAFVKIMKRYGFILKSKDTARVFHFFNFQKAKAMPKGAEKNMDKVLWLKPCLYKKR